MIKRSVGRTWCACVAALLLAGVGVVSASATPSPAMPLIGIDTDNFGTPPTGWHQFSSSGTYSDLTNELGGATNIDLVLDVVGANFIQSINASTLPTHTSSLAGLDDFKNYANSAAFTGLLPGANYNLWVFSLHDGFGGGPLFNATVTGGGGAPEVFAFDMTGTPGDLWINGAVGSSASPLSSYANLTKASNIGRIDINFANTGGVDEIPLAGLALQYVPSPIIGIDFGGNGTPPTGWHQFNTSGTTNDLTDEAGGATNVDFNVQFSGGSIVAQSITATTLPQHANLLGGLDEFHYQTQTATFSDLEAGATYNLWVFSLYDVLFGSVTFDATVTGMGGQQVLSFDVDTAGELLINGTVGSDAQMLSDYAVQVKASAAGTIEVAFLNTGGSISEVPVAGLALQFVMSALTGDLNGDGFVGQDDLNIVLGAWGTNVTPGDLLAGDPSGDGFVGQDDLNDVLAGWGAGTPPSFVLVPEPATFVPAAAFFLCLARSRRIRRERIES